MDEASMRVSQETALKPLRDSLAVDCAWISRQPFRAANNAQAIRVEIEKDARLQQPCPVGRALPRLRRSLSAADAAASAGSRIAAPASQDVRHLLSDKILYRIAVKESRLCFRGCEPLGHYDTSRYTARITLANTRDDLSNGAS